MPDASGRFRGHGWSRHKEDAWTRVFGPALADDPDPDGCPHNPYLPGPCVLCVPTEPPHEVSCWPNEGTQFGDAELSDD